MRRRYERIKNAWDYLVDLIIPRRCAGCKNPHEPLCVSCAKEHFEPWVRCFICGARRKTGSFCPVTCRAKTPKALKKIYWAGPYNGALREAVWQLKYKRRKELAEPLGKLLAQKFHMALGNIGSSCRESDFRQYIVVPVPLHRSKERARGFNQALLIAQSFAKETGISITVNLLKKKTDTKPQARIASREERLKNLTGVFAINPKELEHLQQPQQLERMTIILVDDVATTGATLFEASRALEQAGATTIIGFVAAHG